MAATLKDILYAFRGKKWLENAKNRPRKPNPEGTKIALDILHHFKFPGDTAEEPPKNNDDSQ